MDIPDVEAIIAEINSELDKSIPSLIPKLKMLSTAFGDLYKYFKLSNTSPSQSSIEQVQSILSKADSLLERVTLSKAPIECDSKKWGVFIESIKKLLVNEFPKSLSSLRDYRSVLEGQKLLPKPKTLSQHDKDVEVLAKRLNLIITNLSDLSNKFSSLVKQIG